MAKLIRLITFPALTTRVLRSPKQPQAVLMISRTGRAVSFSSKHAKVFQTELTRGDDLRVAKTAAVLVLRL